MKKLLLILATLITSASVTGETTIKNEITDSFTDKIKNTKEEDKEMLIQFSRHAAFYKLPKTNPRYEELKAKIEKLQKEEKKVKIIAIIPMMEIRNIEE
jgi:hypothetical protein